MIGTDELRAVGVSERLAQQWGPRFAADLPAHGIDSWSRESAFVGQVLHESGMLRHTEENLNYSADALQRVFGKYFPTRTIAESYARQPERIANRVYANRMGNGDEASGDGWRYRGRGFIQLTGHDNHKAYKLWSGDDGEIDPLLSAIWYWLDNDLSRYADIHDYDGLTKAINGGYNGLDDRLELTNRAMLALS